MFCKKKKETFAHIIMCDTLEKEWKIIIHTSLLKTKAKIEKAWLIHAPTEHIKRTLLSNRKNTVTKGKTIQVIIREFVPEGIL
jgi:hypothetical protein